MKWEYGFIEYRPSGKYRFESGKEEEFGDFLPLLNQLGQDRWELVGVVQYGSIRATLKRPVAE